MSCSYDLSFVGSGSLDSGRLRLLGAVAFLGTAAFLGAKAFLAADAFLGTEALEILDVMIPPVSVKRTL